MFAPNGYSWAQRMRFPDAFLTCCGTQLLGLTRKLRTVFSTLRAPRDLPGNYFRFADHPLSFRRGLFVKDVGIPVSVPS